MLRLIIADDEEFIRRGLMSLKWDEHGIQVVYAARNGFEVLDFLKEDTADILLTDIRMPGMTGLELSRQALELCPEMKVILLTGYGEFEYAQEAVKTGVFDYVLKPSTPGEIFACAEAAKTRILEEQKKKREMELILKELDHYAALSATGQILATEPDTESEEVLTKTILRYLTSHYAENVTLSALAEVTHFNTDYLSRYIKQKTGQNFLSILTGIRISHAAKLLISTDLKNYEVAERVGIHDERYFVQVFKKTYGMTPSQFRKTRRKETDVERLIKDEDEK